MSELINMCILHFMAFACAMIGFIYSDVLTEPDMIFHKWYKLLEMTIGERKWLFNPIIGCFRCVSGQLALWTFLYLDFYNSSVLSAVFIHVYYISLTIYISWLISKTYRS